MPDEAFLGLERSLWELELSHCQLTKVPNRALRYLQKLRILDLTGNEINKISPENWRGLEGSLEILILADNSLAKLPLDAFGGLPMVETIDLRGNNLREIDPAQMLCPPEKAFMTQPTCRVTRLRNGVVANYRTNIAKNRED
ncbi:hypothetical protein YQE_09516, partial [Dendroctonus ponderosae]